MTPNSPLLTGHTVTPDSIPTLTQDMSLNDVPKGVSLALDARAEEKRALMALSEELVQNLRPEIERLTSDLVQRTLQCVWEKRAKTHLDL